MVSKANHAISQLSKSMPQPVTLKKLKLNGIMKTYKIFRTNTQKDVFFIIGDRSAKGGGHKAPEVTENLALEYGKK